MMPISLIIFMGIILFIGFIPWLIAVIDPHGVDRENGKSVKQIIKEKWRSKK